MPILRPYRVMPIWNSTSVPKGFRVLHNTKKGTWAKLRVIEGSIRFTLTDEDGNVQSRHKCDQNFQPPLIEPQQWHRIEELSDDARVQLSFLCELSDYFSREYELSRTHSEVIEVTKLLKPCKALDLGCGRGRNSLYLAALGFDVDAMDSNERALLELKFANEKEKLNVKTSAVDFNCPFDLESAKYDLVVNTVVLQFLQKESVPKVIEKMQKATVPGGLNLIVSAMDTPAYPRHESFPSSFLPNELWELYKGWDFIKYNEDVGHLHKQVNGKPVELQFATMIARKQG